MRTSVSHAVIVLACGCNAVFGLDRAQNVGDFYDAHIDAPFTCPPAGTAPTFSRAFQQVVLQPCADYTTSSTTGAALARCAEPTASGVIEEGPIDMSLAPAAGLQDPGFNYTYPRLGPDGDVVVAQVFDRQSGVTTCELFDRTSTGWTRGTQISPSLIILSTTAPSRGPQRRMIALSSDGLHELVEEAGGWSDRTTTTKAQLGVASLGLQMNWTPDGLHLIFNGTLVGQMSSQLLYADRATVDDMFAPAVPLPGIDFVFEGFMTEDCGRVYFSAFDSVFYAPRDG